MEEISGITPGKLYFIDECGIDECLHRTHGYAPRGEIVEEQISGKKYKRTNIVAAKCGKKIVVPLAYQGATDSELSEFWFENILLKEVTEGAVFVLDNASFHRKKRLAELAKNACCDVLFLPPYSPNLNLIEIFWAWLKGKMCSTLRDFDNFDDALTGCFNLV